MLYDLILSFPNCKTPAELSPVLEKLLSLSKSLFVNQSVLPSTSDSLENPYGHWPALPLLRERETYKVEQKRKKEELVCKKLSNGHSVLLPGVFTLFCEHGKCFEISIL